MAGEGIGITDRVSKVTLALWSKMVSDQAKQRYVVLGLLQAKGKIKRGNHGGELRWNVQYKQHDLKPHIDAAASPFERFNEITQANLRWGNYEVLDAITAQERAENGGEQAIVKLFPGRAKLMQQSALQQFGKKIYVDGNAATSQAREMHGLESMMSINTGAQTATDKLATTPNDTYAGISTAYTSLKANAVEFTDEEWGAWSPRIVNANRTVNGTTKAWSNFADEYIRQLLLELQYSNSAEDCPDLGVLRRDSFFELLNVLDDRERVMLHANDEVGAKYGFETKGMVYVDGVPFCWDYGVTQTDGGSDTVHGYVLNTDQMELLLLDEAGGKGDTIFSVFTAREPYRMADLIKLYVFGNFKFVSPRHFGKLAEIS